MGGAGLILLAQAMAHKPQTAFPKVNSVGRIAIFFTARNSQVLNLSLWRPVEGSCVVRIPLVNRRYQGERRKIAGEFYLQRRCDPLRTGDTTSCGLASSRIAGSLSRPAKVSSQCSVSSGDACAGFVTGATGFG